MNHSETEKRKLTKREVKAIKNYKVTPKVEQVIWNIWREDKKPLVSSFFRAKLMSLISLIISYGITALIWINYLYPEMSHITAILNVIIFTLWFAFPFMVIARIVQAVASKNKTEMFKKHVLDVWRKKTGLRPTISKINNIIFLIGLVVSGYFITGAMILVSFILIAFINAIIRSSIQKAMDEIDGIDEIDKVN